MVPAWMPTFRVRSATQRSLGKRRHHPVRRWLAVLLIPLVVGWPSSPASAIREPSPNYHTVSRGSRGENVRAMQYLLRSHGHLLTVDGAFGGGTERTIKQFQARQGIGQDGVVGPGTWGRMVATKGAREGTTGDHVRAITTLLRKWDGGAISPNYGSSVTARVRAFQAHWGLSRDGQVGPTTWRHLVFQYEQPTVSNSLCKGLSNGRDTNNWAGDSWGTSETVGALERASAAVAVLDGQPRAAVRDLSREKGGDIAGHGSHEHGMDVDVRPYGNIANPNFQCDSALTHDQRADLAAGESLLNSSRYGWWRTGHFVEQYRNASISLGRDLHKITLFQDHRVIDSVPEVTWYPNHHNHLHVRSCTRYYPARSTYQCTNNNTNL